eukprot:scaffold8982_cov125-Isochrysis_galbana.AAC.10
MGCEIDHIHTYFPYVGRPREVVQLWAEDGGWSLTPSWVHTKTKNTRCIAPGIVDHAIVTGCRATICVVVGGHATKGLPGRGSECDRNGQDHVFMFTAWRHCRTCVAWSWGGAPWRLPVDDFLFLDWIHRVAALLGRTSGQCPVHTAFVYGAGVRTTVRESALCTVRLVLVDQPKALAPALRNMYDILRSSVLVSTREGPIGYVHDEQPLARHRVEDVAVVLGVPLDRLFRRRALSPEDQIGAAPPRRLPIGAPIAEVFVEALLAPEPRPDVADREDDPCVWVREENFVVKVDDRSVKNCIHVLVLCVDRLEEKVVAVDLRRVAMQEAVDARAEEVSRAEAQHDQGTAQRLGGRFTMPSAEDEREVRGPPIRAQASQCVDGALKG